MTKFKKFNRKYLDLSWKWINDPELKDMISAKTITRAEQIIWFNSIQALPNYSIWGIENDGNPIGVCGLKNISKEDAEYWGYIGEKDYWGKGIGSEILEFLMAYAGNKKLKSIYLYVTNTNGRAKKLYEKHGFITEEIKENIIKMRLYL
ncbi:MAG: GNAT family N-acetyltransferase [Bacteroidota bacterium]